MATSPRTRIAWQAAGLVGGLAALAAAQTQTVQISFQDSPTPISPYIYGANEWCNPTDVPFTATRWGGNRQSGYNWETNASNAGSDYIHNSDNHLVMNLPQEEQKQPARAVEKLHQTFSPRKQYIQATVQLAGYVAADMNGTVSEAETAPSARWKKVVFEKTGGLSLTPNISDGEVYMDEYVNYVASKVGKSSAGGIRAWSLDNEPGLWRYTHPRIHPGVLNVGPMIEKSAGAARAIKKVDPGAEVYGPAAWGWTEFRVLDDQGDWKSAYGKQHDSWISTYLALMKAEGDKVGKRLLDVLDIHWYPEHQGDCRIIMNGCDQNSASQAEARVQAPRSLWDETFLEKSWINQAYDNKPIKLLEMMKTSIAEYYPGTRLAITEYEYGGHDHWSGGLAQADVLGIFGREGVYMATLWSQPGRYTKSAFKLFLDYDGQGGRFGDLSVPAASGSRAALSVFASLETKDATKLHIVAINKTATAQSTQFTLPGGTFTSGVVYGFDEASGGTITSRGTIAGLTPGAFTYSLPPRSVLHFVLAGNPIVVNVRLAPAPYHRGRDGSTGIFSLDGRMRTQDPGAGRSRATKLAAGRYFLE
ncbi:MAG TPA: glycoside hydrolase family 44 protein [Fibrobacteria bacterium]|nr:glycoside hydrolase family 44 protein [Fibrobacteria bacterium]